MSQIIGKQTRVDVQLQVLSHNDIITLSFYYNDESTLRFGNTMETSTQESDFPKKELKRRRFVRVCSNSFQKKEKLESHLGLARVDHDRSKRCRLDGTLLQCASTSSFLFYLFLICIYILTYLFHCFHFKQILSTQD